MPIFKSWLMGTYWAGVQILGDLWVKGRASLLDENGKEHRREAQNMAERFRKHANAYFQFITTPSMDPINNLAEQAIRFMLIDRHLT